MIKCNHCGNEILTSSRFCEHCGNVVESKHIDELLSSENSVPEEIIQSQPTVAEHPQDHNTVSYNPDTHAQNGTSEVDNSSIQQEYAVNPYSQYQEIQSPIIQNERMLVKNKNTLTIMIVVGGILILLLLIIIFVLATRNQNATPLNAPVSYNAGLAETSGERFNESSQVDDDEIYQLAVSLHDDKIIDLVQSFYRSYLNCVNSRDTNLLEYATEEVRTEVENRLSAPGNIQYYFEFSSCEIIPNSRHNLVTDDLPTINLDIQFMYQYWEREGNQERVDGSNTQSIQLQYINSEWIVSGFVHHGR